MFLPFWNISEQDIKGGGCKYNFICFKLQTFKTDSITYKVNNVYSKLS